jgi:hypothetical protein
VTSDRLLLRLGVPREPEGDQGGEEREDERCGRKDKVGVQGQEERLKSKSKRGQHRRGHEGRDDEPACELQDDRPPASPMQMPTSTYFATGGRSGPRRRGARRDPSIPTGQIPRWFDPGSGLGPLMNPARARERCGGWRRPDSLWLPIFASWARSFRVAHSGFRGPVRTDWDWLSCMGNRRPERKDESRTASGSNSGPAGLSVSDASATDRDVPNAERAGCRSGRICTRSSSAAPTVSPSGTESRRSGECAATAAHTSLHEV